MNGANKSERVTALDRVGATPFRDLLRGRMTGRLSVNILLRDAGVPATLHGIIRQTVRRTRLLRIEKSEVASELITHFRDGLDAGHSSDSLVNAFGDPCTAARLIRRAKKRDRSLPLKATILTLKSLGVLLLVMVVVYAGLAVRYFGTQRGPIVDYVPTIAARASAVPESQRAWPVYRQALIDSEIFTEDKRVLPDSRPGWRNWSALAEHLRAHRATLEKFRQAAALDGLGYIPGLRIAEEDLELWPGMAGSISDGGLMAGSMIEVLLPHLGATRRIAGLLVADARLAASEGDGERAAQDLIATVRLARQSREIPFLINDLVAISIAWYATEEALLIIDAQPDLFSDEALRELAHLLAGFPGDGEPLVRLEGERVFFDDAVQRLYSLNANGNGVVIAGALAELESLTGETPSDEMTLKLAGPVAAAVLADRKEIVRFHHSYLDSAEAWIRTPAWKRPTLDDPFENEDTVVGRTRYALAFALTPAVGRALRQGEQFDQQRNAAMVVIAVELFRRREGRLPETLAELTPAYLPTVPVDMFDGGPLKYRVDGDSFIVYSIGNDYMDDGGRAASPYASSRWIARDEAERRIALARARDPETIKRTGRGSRAPGIGDGDWVIFPPPIPNEPLPPFEYENDDPLRPIEREEPPAA